MIFRLILSLILIDIFLPLILIASLFMLFNCLIKRAFSKGTIIDGITDWSKTMKQWIEKVIDYIKGSK